MSRFLYLLTGSLLLATGWATALAQSSPTATPAQRLNLTLVENRSTFNINAQQNEYVNTLRLSQPGNDNPNKLTAGMLNNGNNYITFTRTDDANNASEFARINLSAVVTKHEEELIDGLTFSSNPPSSQTTITQDMLPDNWGTDGSNLIWQTSGYAYITNTTGFTYTIPTGYSNTTIMFYIINGSNARGGYWAINTNSEGWSIAARATAGYGSTIVMSGLNSGDVISFIGAQYSNNSYSLYYSPDIDGIYVFTLPDSYLPTIDVTPTVSYWDGSDWGSPTSIGQNQSYEPNDTVNLFNLGTVIDAFNVNTEQNSYSEYYNYKVTFNGNIILPSGSSTGLDFYSSADFSACTTSDPSSAAMTGYNGWTFNESNAYSSSGIISVYIEYYGDIIFTMTDSFMGNSVNVTVTSSRGDDGAGILYVNGVLHTFTAGETYTWTVPVSANGTIEFKSDGQTYSVDISSIVISSGNGSALNAPVHTGKSLYKGLNIKKAAPVTESQKERNKKVIIND